MEGFIQHALRLPGLLESVDAASSISRTGTATLDGIVLQLLSLENDLVVCWSAEVTRRSDLRLAREVIAESSRHTSARTGMQHRSGSSPFPSFLSALTYCFYWTCLLVLRSALEEVADIIASRDLCTQLQGSWTSNPAEVADLLYGSIPFLLQTAGGATAQAVAVRAPIHFLQRYFRRIKAWQKLEWCDKIETQVRERAAYLQWDALLPWSFVAMNWLAA